MFVVVVVCELFIYFGGVTVLVVVVAVKWYSGRLKCEVTAPASVQGCPCRATMVASRVVTVRGFSGIECVIEKMSFVE